MTPQNPAELWYNKIMQFYLNASQRYYQISAGQTTRNEPAAMYTGFFHEREKKEKIRKEKKKTEHCTEPGNNLFKLQ